MNVPKTTQLSLPDYRKLKIILISLGLAIAAFGAGLAFAMALPPPLPDVPQEVRQKGFPIFIPAKLPGTFAIDEKSFGTQEEVVLFWAIDNAGENLVFTQQKKPADFNFNDFYKNQMKDAKVIDDTPFPTVLGKSPDGSATLVSIIAEDTWVIISSQTPLNENNAKSISQSLQKM